MTEKKPPKPQTPTPETEAIGRNGQNIVTRHPHDPDLAALLRVSAEQRVRAQIASAKQRADQRRQTRAEFGERRKIGLRSRHATKAARQNLTQHHQQKGTQP